MKTKLVYVLTCAPDKHYIEQALMSVWSARHWNSDAHIVLMVDDLTDKLLVGKRAEILDYISEKIVVPFEDSSLSPMYRSRFIKTSIRQRVDGIFLFVDCDTIIQKPLTEIDTLDCDLAMVPDEHLPVEAFNSILKSQLTEKTEIFGYDVLREKWYYNSGVMFAKDTPEVHSFWNCWHNEWLTGEKKGVGIDQPSLGKANCLSNHIIKNLSDEWNTLVYMNPIFIEDAKILHFWQFRNRSLMFCEPYLEYVKVHGVDDYVKRCMLNPLASVLPSDNVLKSYTIRRWLKLIIIVKQELKLFVKQIGEISSTPWFDKFNKIETAFLKCKLYGFTSVLYFMRRFLHVKIGKNKNKNLKVCFS